MSNNTENSTIQTPVFVGLDVMKFICALLVVYLHTYNHDWGAVGEWVHANLSPIGVPFFFIVSGFLYMKKLQESGEGKKEYFYHYLKRVTYMYIFWSAVTLPIEWMNTEIAHGDYSFFMKLMYIVRGFFLTGSIGIYWYVLALIYNSVILFYALKWHKMNMLFVLSCLFFIIGILYDSGMIRATILGEFIHVVIGSERNFLNVGLFYMCVGGFFAKKDLSMHQFIIYLLLLLCLVLSSYMKMISSYKIMQAPLAILLFILAMSGNFRKLASVSLKMRQWSTALYLGHFPFILVFDYYLKRGSIVDVPVSILFSLVLFYVIYISFPNRYVRIIYG